MNVQIAEICCCNCNLTFWVTDEHDEQLRKCHNIFYCPNGHRQHYLGKTEAQKQRERANKLDHQLQFECNRAKSFKNSNTALRGVITKMKKGKK